MMCHKKMNAKFGISTQMLSKKVMSYSRFIQRVYFFVDLCPPTETVMCRYFAFKGAFKRAPKSNCNLKVICFQIAPNSH